MELITSRYKLKDINFPDKLVKAVSKTLKEYGIEFENAEFIRKGIVPEDVKFEENENASIDWINTIRRDRDNEIVHPKGAILDDYRQNPVVVWSHDYKSLPIGRNQWIKTNDQGLIAKTEYYVDKELPQDMGARVWRYRKAGFPLGKSIGFIPLSAIESHSFKKIDLKELNLKEEDLDGVERIYDKWIMLEYSDTPIPSNPGAIQIALAKGLVSEEEAKNLGYNIETEQKNGDVESDVSESISDELQTEGKGQKEGEEKAEDEGFSVEGKEENNSETKGENGESETEEGLEEETKSVTCQCSSCNYETESENGSCDMECPECGESMSAIGEEACNKPKKPKKDTEVFTKPEVTENTIRIPVDSGNHDGHKLRTITMSSSQGINALYCVTDKKILTYIFAKDKWDMQRAREWVNSHKPKKNLEETITLSEGEIISSSELEETKDYKERWNKSLSKLWDVANAPSNPSDYETSLYCKFLGCRVKDIYKTTFDIPSPLLGSYFGAFKNLCSNLDYKDTRDIEYGREVAPSYETIQLNSKTSEDFLIKGIDFYEKDKEGIILRFYPTWYGQCVDIITSRENKDFNKQFINDIHKWVNENNYLRNEKFNLNGEFIDTKDSSEWENVILNHTNKRAMKLVEKLINEKSDDFKGRGVLMLGNPGTGKTLSGKTLLDRTDKTFIWVAASDFGKFQYREHKCIELTFSLARKLAPCIVFMEDVDGYLHSGSGKIFDHLKTELDGLRGNKGIVTILTSNYPEKLPDALLDRPGRFHDVLLFDLPDKELRTEMINKWVGEDVGEDLMEILLESTDGYSGAHMRELVDLAKSISEDEEMEVVEALIESLEKLNTQRQLIATIREKREKSVDDSEEKDNSEWKITSGTLNVKDITDYDSSTYSLYLRNGKYFDKNGKELDIQITQGEDLLFDKEEKLPKDEFVKKSEMEEFLEGLKSIIAPKLEEKKGEEEVVETKEIDVNSKEFVSTVKDCIVEILQGSKIDVKELLQEELKKANGEMF